MRIVLIGFMGAGKSTIGKILADVLSFNFIEMDALVLDKSGYDTIANIFSQKGEPFFRDLETSVAKSLTDLQNVVISTGGGTPCRSENVVALKSANTLVVYLATSFEVAQARIGNDSTRPLWQDLTKTRDLFNLRDPLYRSVADLVINAEAPSDLIIAEIHHMLQQRSSI